MGIELAKRGRTDGHERLSCDADFHIGAHILLLARGKDGLELAKKEVLLYVHWLRTLPNLCYH
jgi:hypothetical protein